MQEVQWLTDQEQKLWRSILNAKRAVDRAIDLQLQETLDISTADFSVLVVLSEAEGNVVRMRALCDALDWDRSRMSHQITRMERRGLVTKERCECDNRGIDVQLTGHGLEIIKKAAPNHVRLVRRVIFDVLGQDTDYEKISGVLNQIADVADQQRDRES
ncbi:MarR family winged helix-turn-helix transcriptional regulator [Corynebacterium lactis]|uniref:MarR family transcriptional regulator n=1 Tax=Corynebacterium lactis RW2-5 TaxID=1408189 RepID=A0A0K2H015_9CORY|nr:MarR family winged helix-turn-helix transcriptional regulator [Corynebacterium lactis]ALA67076.1 MarR family transcriptional regulator [Corynebacterium lactis RW2-5]